MGKGRKRKSRKKPSDVKPASSGSESHRESGSSRKRKVRNRVSSSSDMSTCDEASSCVSELSAAPSVSSHRPAATTVVQKKPPPIMVRSMSLDTLLREMEAAKINAVYKMCHVGTKVMPETRKDWDATVSLLTKSRAEFYSHDFPSEKPFKSVVRGLPAMDTKAIEKELVNRYKLKPLAVHRIVRKDEIHRQYRDCLYLVHFKKGTVTPSALQAVRTIRSIVVRWEQYRGSRNDVTQCQRCLNFGHGTRNCHIKPRCSNCSQTHATSDCLLEGAVKYRCANCKGEHRGSDRTCPKREEFKRIRKQASTSNQPRRKQDKPPPPMTDERYPTLQPRVPTRNATPPPTAQRWLNTAVQQPQQSGVRSTTPPPVTPKRTVPTPRNSSSRTPQPELETSNEALPDKFTMAKLMEIFEQMLTELQKCRDRREQIRCLGRLIIQYGC